jgi:SAM-dependent methyltransferase
MRTRRKMIQARSYGDLMERENRRQTFDEVPELYDRARPQYPSQLFSDLVKLSGLSTGARVLEIGCGTGQATIPLAERGFNVVCIELGEGLAAIARRRLARYPCVEIVSGQFERWEHNGPPFDAVAAFTAFHWIDPAVRYEKSHSVLKPMGILAIVATKHVLPEDGDPFFAEVQEDYNTLYAEGHTREAPVAPPRPDLVPDLGADIAASGLFRNVAVRRYLWDVTYTGDDYIAVLGTYSGHRALAAETRDRLYERIRSRIDARPERTVRKTYLATLNIAQRF